MSTVYFITHPEVSIDPDIAVPDWSLSDVGIRRMKEMLALEWVSSIKSIYCSREKKAIDGAEILADHLSLPFTKLEELGENDRSATGYLPANEFEQVADQFFAEPEKSARGWETAQNEQLRIVAAVRNIVETVDKDSPIAIVSHGGVGALLLCHLRGCAISREYDQPGGGGGNYFSFDSRSLEVNHGWRAIDAPHS